MSDMTLNPIGIIAKKPYYVQRYKLEIDLEKCGNAVLCLQCVKACNHHGAKCISYVNRETPDPDNQPKTLRDIHHIVGGGLMYNCDGCGLCVEACPKQCIRLIPPEPQLPRAVIPAKPATVRIVKLKDGTSHMPAGE